MWENGTGPTVWIVFGLVTSTFIASLAAAGSAPAASRIAGDWDRSLEGADRPEPTNPIQQAEETGSTRQAGPTVDEECEDRDPHPPIRVTEDEGPQGYAITTVPQTGLPVPRPGSGVVSGTGTAENPYVIEGWCIRPTPNALDHLRDVESVGILVEDTDAHVVVRDTVVDGKTAREPLDPVVSRQSHGILVRGAANVTVSENLVANHQPHGIRVDGARDTTVTGNEVVANGFAVSVVDAARVTVAGNTFQANEFGRIGLAGSTAIEVRNHDLGSKGLLVVGDSLADFQHRIAPSNTVNGEPIRYLQGGTNVDVPEPVGQAFLVNTSGAVVDGVHLSASVGLKVAFSEDTTVTDNTFDNNTATGIDVQRSDGPLIQDNRFRNHPFSSIRLEGTNGGEITANSFEAIEFGITLDETTRTTISANGIQDLSGYGVWAEGASNTIVASNTVAGLPDEYRVGGAIFQDSSDVAVTGNEITSTSRGIELQNSHGTTITNNDLRGNTDGIFLFETQETTVSDNVLSNNVGGMVTFEAAETEITNNTARNNTEGIFLFRSRGQTITHNVLADNLDDGVALRSTRGLALHANNIQGNGHNGLQIASSGSTIDATGNWWGQPSGPSGGVQDACTGTLADGQGDSIEDEGSGVCFEPWLRSPVTQAGPPP